jgi:multicomponent Na+:H+ antiporter subunit B
VSERARTALLLAAFAMLAPGLWALIRALPAFGHPTSAYGQTVNALLPGLRGVSNMVAAVNFDVRGIDTVGEELMLMAATTGATVLLRGRRGEGVAEQAGQLPGRAVTERADATSWLGRIGASVMLLFGLYVVLHGTVTPGGGFQGGVIIASALLTVYLADGYPTWRRIARGPALSALEGGGALTFVIAALVPLALGHPALANILPLGTWKDLFSGGLMVIVNLAVGVSVTGSFGLILLEFLEETRSSCDDDMTDEAER